MKLGQKVTIHTYDNDWEQAQVVGFRKDTLMGTEDVYIVRHHHFEEDLDFYIAANGQGQHLNVGNAAFWIDNSWVDADE